MSEVVDLKRERGSFCLVGGGYDRGWEGWTSYGEVRGEPGRILEL